MDIIPAGTLTFLFTDVEGSSVLWEQFPSQMKLALETHDKTMRREIESSNGFVFKTVGDAFCATFSRPLNAVNAAVSIQRELSSKDWDQAVIKVRMALHSGTAEERDGDYFGPTLNRTARLEAAAHGGQIILSSATRELIIDHLPPDYGLVELGEISLRNLERPESVYQLTAPKLEKNFSPLKTDEKSPNNLPPMLTTFIGRQNELSEIKSLIRDNRLLTLLGPGGIGKTRISIQVSKTILKSFTDGIWFIDLGAITNSDYIFKKMAEALRIGGETSITQEQNVTNYLKRRSVLLLLDNCEHMIENCAKAAHTILINCPDAKILATSRSPLKIMGEVNFHVPALALPDLNSRTVEKLNTYDSARLFIERATRINSRFSVSNTSAPALAQICVWLDGLPLALELAAGKTRMFALPDILENLKNSNRLLRSNDINLQPRQRNLLSLVDWSYQLLTTEEKQVLNRLSVFNGTWNFDAAEALCLTDVTINLPDEPLYYQFINKANIDLFSFFAPELSAIDFDMCFHSLVEKSLLTSERTESSQQFRMMVSIRDFARGKLKEAGDEEKSLERLLDYYILWTERLELETYRDMRDNVQKALLPQLGSIEKIIEWALKKEATQPRGMRLVGALHPLFRVFGLYNDGFKWANLYLNLPISFKYPLLRFKLLFSCAIFSSRLQIFEQGRDYADEAYTISLELKSEPALALALRARGLIYFFIDQKIAREALEKGISLGEKYQLSFWQTSNLMNLGLVYLREKNLSEGYNCIKMSYKLGKKFEMMSSMGLALTNIGSYHLCAGNYEESLESCNKAVVAFKKSEDRLHHSVAVFDLGISLRCLGRVAEAEQAFQESWRLADELGFFHGIERSIGLQAQMASLRQEDGKAAALLKEACGLHKNRPIDSHDVSYLIALSHTCHYLKYEQLALLLTAALEPLQETMSDVFPPCDIEKNSKILMELKNEFSTEEFKTEKERGQSLSFDELIDEIYNEVGFTDLQD
jgi:predicted ATPase/class 3 adenylate cyclase